MYFLSMLTEPRIIESAMKSFELSKMAYVESYGGLGQDLRGICGFQKRRVSESQKKKVHSKSHSQSKLGFWFLSTLNPGGL